MESYDHFFNTFSGFSDKSDMIKLLYSQYFAIYLIFISIFEGFSSFGYAYYITFSLNILFLIFEIVIYIHLIKFSPTDENIEFKCKILNIILDVFFYLCIGIFITTVIICKDILNLAESFDKFFMSLYCLLALTKIILIKVQQIYNSKLYKNDN